MKKINVQFAETNIFMIQKKAQNLQALFVLIIVMNDTKKENINIYENV